MTVKRAKTKTMATPLPRGYAGQETYDQDLHPSQPGVEHIRAPAPAPPRQPQLGESETGIEACFGEGEGEIEMGETAQKPALPDSDLY